MNHTQRDEHAPYASDALLHAWMRQSRDPAMPSQFVRIDARAIADAHAGVIDHASIVLERSDTAPVIRYADRTSDLPQQWLNPAIPQLTLHHQLLIPALVNAHTHLDLTHIGPLEHDPGEGFVRWVDVIRANRAQSDEEIAQCVRLGIEKSLAGGVIAVGDIAGAPAGRLTEAPVRTLADSPLHGVSYLEFFGIGKSAASAIKRVEAFLAGHLANILRDIDGSGVRFGLQPHATNTIDLSVYQWVTLAARAHDLPLSTHLAETLEEREFIASASGPQRELLERLGVWDDAILDHIGKGKHPIEHLSAVLELKPYLVAHVNDADDAGIETLAMTGTSVAYCPRASKYFDAASNFGAHRYRDMLDAGVNVCLGTDSIVNLDTPDRISTLDEIRLLYAQGDHDPNRLLSMATINGAKALGLDPNRFTLQPGSFPFGILSIDLGESSEQMSTWASALQQVSAPSWVI
jgi:cytosine/adenosine deaminase-related metal-dependent hydrolase